MRIVNIIVNIFVMIGLFFGVTANAQQSKGTAPLPQKGHAEKVTTTPTLSDWLAFGSGCNSSKSKPTQDVRLETTFDSKLSAKIFIQSLRLKMEEKQSGLSECALRLSVQPAVSYRISHVSARTRLLATKDQSIHMRSHILLLVGDTLVARQSWDLRTVDFARHRQQDVFLSAGSNGIEMMPRTECGKPQIIGMDFTFEGKRDSASIQKTAQKMPQPAESSELKTVSLTAGEKSEAATIDVFFEKCSN